MKVNTLKLNGGGLPLIFSNIPQPPKEIYWAGASPRELLPKPRVSVVGSRKATSYGRFVTDNLCGNLARAGVIIISGLAFGIDSYSHEAAIKTGGLTVAVLPSPLDKIYPASHHSLAERILGSGGALISEYPPGTEVRNYNFIARNRLISALADVLIVVEAARNSGALHTANFALEQGKTVMAVPGNINSPTSVGCNNLIKSGALPITSSDDVFFNLGMVPTQSKDTKLFSGTPEQQIIMELLGRGIYDQEELAMAQRAPEPTV